jgi:hypothetical protein
MGSQKLGASWFGSDRECAAVIALSRYDRGTAGGEENGWQAVDTSCMRLVRRGGRDLQFDIFLTSFRFAVTALSRSIILTGQQTVSEKDLVLSEVVNSKDILSTSAVPLAVSPDCLRS